MAKENRNEPKVLVNGKVYSHENIKSAENIKSCEETGAQIPYNETDHYVPSVRLLRVPKTANGACGFNLTRSKWDPYPWVMGVDADTPAALCGLKAGDCVLEVNGEDVLGLRIKDIAQLVKLKANEVTLLLWNSGWDPTCDPQSLCCGPMPRSLQRLSVIMQSILAIIECPVCLDTISPPAMQCQNGHLLCVNCRIRAEKCPVCRDRYTPRRALIAEQIYTAITNAFNLCRSEDKLRYKIFGPNAQLPMSLNCLETPNDTQQHKKKKKARQQKANARAPVYRRLEESELSASPSPSHETNAKCLPRSPASIVQSESTENQLCDKNHLTHAVTATTKTTTTTTTTTTTMKGPNTTSLTTSPTHYGAAPVNDISQHSSSSTNDLSPAPATLKAIEGVPGITTDALTSTQIELKSTPEQAASKSRYQPDSPATFLLYLGNRRPCSSLTNSFECLQTDSLAGDLRAISPKCFTAPHCSPVSSSGGSFCSSSNSSGISTYLDEMSTSSTPSNKDELLSTSRCPSAPPRLHINCALEQPAKSSEKSLGTQTLTTSSSTAPSTVELSLAPVDTSSPATMTLEAPLLSALTPPDNLQQQQAHHHQLALKLPHKTRGGRYQCPCDCGRCFKASAQLQRHVKVEHRVPILSFGAPKAKLALPLRQPLDDAVLILEIGDDSDGGDAWETENGDAAGSDYDKSCFGCCDGCVKSDDKAVRRAKKTPSSKECWIRIKTLGPDCISTSALLQASDCN